jgi:hypothetical protein
VLLIKTSAFCWNNNCVIINKHGKTTLKNVGENVLSQKFTGPSILFALTARHVRTIASLMTLRELTWKTRYSETSRTHRIGTKLQCKAEQVLGVFRHIDPHPGNI